MPIYSPLPTAYYYIGALQAQSHVILALNECLVYPTTTVQCLLKKIKNERLQTFVKPASLSSTILESVSAPLQLYSSVPSRIIGQAFVIKQSNHVVRLSFLNTAYTFCYQILCHKHYHMKGKAKSNLGKSSDQ
jgi:hypothetical protein